MTVVVQTHIEVFQLGFGRGLIHKLQHGAQIANVDASLVQGLGQRGAVHGQGAVIQTVFNLVAKHRRCFKFSPSHVIWIWERSVLLTSDGT